jgi:hypothetical protein
MAGAVPLATDRKAKCSGARGRVTTLDALINIFLSFALFGLAGGIALEVNGFERGLCVIAAVAGAAAAFITAVGHAFDRRQARRHAAEYHRYEIGLDANINPSPATVPLPKKRRGRQ